MVTKTEAIKQCKDNYNRAEVYPGITVIMVADGFYEGCWNRGKGYYAVSGDIAHVVKVVNGWIRTKKRQDSRCAQQTSPS